MSSWSCPHDLDGVCQKVRGAKCDPGMKGCVLYGKVTFASEDKNTDRKPVKATAAPRTAAESAGRKKKPEPQKRRLFF